MDLIAEVKQKNDQLLLQNAVLQQSLYIRINTSKFGSFLITFALAPFIVGAVVQLGVGANSSTLYQLRRATLASFRFWLPS